MPCFLGCGRRVTLRACPGFILLHALALTKPGAFKGLSSGLASAPTGRPEWLRFQEAEYKFFEHHSSWAQAQRICTWFQAELASIHNQAELDFLGQNLQKVGMRGSKWLPAGKGQRLRIGKPLTLSCLPPSPVLRPWAALVDRPAHLGE